MTLLENARESMAAEREHRTPVQRDSDVSTENVTDADRTAACVDRKDSKQFGDKGEVQYQYAQGMHSCQSDSPRGERDLLACDRQRQTRKEIS